MTAKEYLQELIDLDKTIKRKQQQLRALRSMSLSTTPNCGDEAVQHTRETNPIEKIISKIVDLEKEINKDSKRLLKLKSDVWDTIEQLNDERMKTILWLRYFEQMTWEYIGNDLSFSIRYAIKLHNTALEILDEKII